MKIVICGGESNFLSYLIDKLMRESHTVYCISDKDAPIKSQKSDRVIVYNITLSDDYAQYVLGSIGPDMVIFLGAQDENYNWEERNASQSKYLSGLINVLTISATLGVERFIYISDYSVFGKDLLADPQDITRTNPDTIKGIVVSEGERICRELNKMMKANAVVVRIHNIYGPLNRVKNSNDRILNICTAAAAQRSIQVFTSRPEPYTYVNDAADAVYRLVDAGYVQGDTYNATGGQPVTPRELADMVRALDNEEPPITLLDESTPVEEVPQAIDIEPFTKETGYKEFNTVEQGVAKTYRWATKYRKNYLPEEPPAPPKGIKQVLRSAMAVLSNILPFLETVGIFLAALALLYFSRGVALLENIDFMLLMVVVVSATFGKQQASLAVLLAAAVFVGDKYLTGYRIVDIFIDYTFIVRLFTLFAIGIVVGHTRDRMREYIKDRDDQIAYNRKEIEDLTEIYQTTLKIKGVLEDRLLNYGDSLAKIQSVVSELESLLPQKIMLNAVNVVMRIMGSREVAIYYYDSRSDYCRLVAASAGDFNSGTQKSMKMASMPDMAFSLNRREVYVNRNLTVGQPIMASAVYRGEQIIAVVMIWNMEFERLSPYQTNLMAILTRMISASIERAFMYEEAAHSTKLIEGTYMYTEEAMAEFFDVVEDAQRQHKTPHVVVDIHAPLAEHVELSGRLASQLRAYDYLGYSHGELIVLLSNTSAHEAQFFIKRITGMGIQANIRPDYGLLSPSTGE